jgi:dihydrofolate reductase
VCGSFEDGLAHAREKDGEKIFIIGGGQIYEQALPYVDRLELTIVYRQYDCDIFFPAFQHAFEERGRQEHRTHDPPFAFCTFQRAQ